MSYLDTVSYLVIVPYLVVVSCLVLVSCLAILFCHLVLASCATVLYHKKKEKQCRDWSNAFRLSREVLNGITLLVMGFVLMFSPVIQHPIIRILRVA